MLGPKPSVPRLIRVCGTRPGGRKAAAITFYFIGPDGAAAVRPYFT